MKTSLQMVVILLLAFLAIAAIDFGICSGSHDVVCPEREKQALLSFKQHLKDPSDRLSSWKVDEDCCKWAGVVCNNLTGHVFALHLRNPPVSYPDTSLGGEINPSLLNLKHLNYLDLSGNDFQGIPIPSFIGSLATLQYLNLSDARFEGTIPHQLGNLSGLRFLSLKGGMDVENLQWLLGLSHLEHLDLSGVNLTSEHNWLQEINKLPSLVELHLSDCQLDHIPKLAGVNFTSLAILDLSKNDFRSLIPRWIFSLGSLIFLDLRNNLFHCPFSTVQPNMTLLKYLDLSGNDLNCTIPSWLYSFSRLEFLDLSSNQLEGGISNEIGNLSSLVSLKLSHNYNLGGRLPNAITNLGSLNTLDLSFNRLVGRLPNAIGNLTSLGTLKLQDNKFVGRLPSGLGNLSKLQDLHVSKNLLEGIVSEVHFSNLASLNSLYAFGNQLTLKVSPNWIPPFQLQNLHLASWNLGPEFPVWLQSQKVLQSLDLSCTGISAKIPTWFWNLTSLAVYRNLSHNDIHGEIPYVDARFPIAVSRMYLNSNKLSGPLPLFSSNLWELDLSDNAFSGSISHFLCEWKEKPRVMVLHLGKNLLSGEIPDCWTSWSFLSVIEMDDNNLTGNIPSSMGNVSSLRSLHLGNNHLSGEIPSALQNCDSLEVIDLSENEFIGSIPKWMGERLSRLKILNLRSNKLEGAIPAELCHLSSLQILDLADNNLSGVIPTCINNFTSMAVKLNSSDPISFGRGREQFDKGVYYYFFEHSLKDLFEGFLQGFLDYTHLVTKGGMYQYDKILALVAVMDLSNNNLSGNIPEELTSLLGLISLNLSGNHLSGVIPKKIGSMGWLGSLDLSRNQLYGEIPPSMSGLTFLGYLNLSYNNLSGKIPSSTQLQSFDASSFIGNKLCGLPLTKNCSVRGGTPREGNEGDSEGVRSEVDWFYLCMAMGFAVGFWCVSIPILFIKSWRCAYFGFLENVWTRLVLLYKRKRV